MRDSLTRKCFSNRSTTASNLAGLPRACFRRRGVWEGGWSARPAAADPGAVHGAARRLLRGPVQHAVLQAGALLPRTRARAHARAPGRGRKSLIRARLCFRPPLPGADCECVRRPWRVQKEDASKDQNALHRLFVAGQVRTRGVGQLAAWMEGPLVGSAWRDSFGGALCECGVEVQARSLLPVAACHEQGWFAWRTDGCPARLGRKGPEK